MRTEQELYDLILAFARKDERIRVVAMNGSRANPNAPRDAFQDYDIVFLVTDMDSFLADDAWLNYFGKRIIMQKPEAMELFPSERENRFSYLMLFEDGNRIDLTLLPADDLDQYLREDSILQILLDKDGIVPALPESTDQDYWIKRPTPGMFDDCCNEFWWLSTYVAKGLARGQLPYANAHLNLMREELMRMLTWKLGFEKGFNFSIGKDYKYLQNYIPEKDWAQLLRTWRMESFDHIQASLSACLSLFRDTSKIVSEISGFSYPDYDAKVTAYLKRAFEIDLHPARQDES